MKSTSLNRLRPHHCLLYIVLFTLFSLFLPWFSAAQPIPHHENVPKDPDAAAALFVKQFRQVVPYYSAPYHFTVTDVAQNKNNHSVRLTVRVDADQTIQPEKEYYIPFIAAPDMPWDITLLADNGYDLCMQVNSDRTINNYYGYGGLMVILTNADLIRAVGIDASKRPAVSGDRGQGGGGVLSDAEMAQIGRDYLAKYARTISPRLPMNLGEGEYFVQCYYSDTLFTMTLEYIDTLWTDVRQLLLGHLDDIRISLAQTLVEDTSHALAVSAYVAKIPIRHIYRNRAQTDSVEVTVTPGMLDYLFTQSTTAPTSPDEYLLDFAQRLNRRAPMMIDEATRLVSCTYDSVTHQLSYTYDISEEEMLQFENNPSEVEELRESILGSYRSDDDPDLTSLLSNVIAAGATIRHHYRSPHGRQPVVIVFTPDEIAATR